MKKSVVSGYVGALLLTGTVWDAEID